MVRKTIRSDVKTRAIEIKMDRNETKKARNPKTVKEDEEYDAVQL